jgi:hypothetical protein
MLISLAGRAIANERGYEFETNLVGILALPCEIT